MPVVAHSIRIPDSLAVSLFLRTVLLISFGISSSPGFCQEATPPASTEKAKPEPAAEVQTNPAPAASVPAAQPVLEGCMKEQLDQQKLTRSIRDMRDPLPRPSRADAARLKKDYQGFLANGFTGPAETKTVQDHLVYVIHEATDPAFVTVPENMQNLLDDVKNDLARAATGIGNAANQQTARKKYCAEVLKAVKPLLDNNLDSRLLAVKTMQMLYDVMPVQNGARARLHSDAMVALLAVLSDKKQPNSVKVTVVSSLHNVLVNCDVVGQDQDRICDSILAELSRPCTETAYQLALLDALMEISLPRRTIGAPEPTSFKAFAAVLDDKSKPVEVRCHAAAGIGRGAFDLQMKLDPLAWKIASVAADTAIEFNRQPGNPKWPECGWDLLVAFRHITAAEATGPVLNRKGLMNRDEKSTVIATVAPFITTVALHLIDNKTKFNVAQLQPLAGWIQAPANRPANLTWDANAPPLKP